MNYYGIFDAAMRIGITERYLRIMIANGEAVGAKVPARQLWGNKRPNPQKIVVAFSDDDIEQLKILVSQRPTRT